MLILRSAQVVLDTKVGGFLFRTMPAEELCGGLTDWLWQYCRAFLGEDWREFEKLAALVSRDDQIFQAALKLDAFAGQDATAQKCLTILQDTMTKPHARDVLDNLLRAVKLILEFENNRMWYPEWYATPPGIAVSSLTLDGMDLPDDKKRQLKDTVQKYRNAVPPECVA